jgi:hypothetical protein
MKIIKNGSFILVVLDNGNIFQKSNCSDEFYNTLLNASDEDVIRMFNPGADKIYAEIDRCKTILERVKESKILKQFGSSIYWPEVSELSMPEDFILKILEAEANNNEDALEGYKNFWTLLSLNPDSRCRANLFWYLDTWGMKISKSGLFIGYRNVNVLKEGSNNHYSEALCEYTINEYKRIKQQKKGPGNYYVYLQPHSGGRPDYYTVKAGTDLFDDMVNSKVPMWNLKTIYTTFEQVDFNADRLGKYDTVYTDAHTGTTRIQIGKMVTIPRSQCDDNQDNQCSSGLHLANAEWLVEGYFGTVGLTCLCNPADVVAVPCDSTYGKLRTCAYLPIAITEYDEEGNVIPLNVEDGFESSWVKTILYDGITATETSPKYRIEIPDSPELKVDKITKEVLEIARKFINEKQK